MSTVIRSIGVASPDRTIAQSDAAELAVEFSESTGVAANRIRKIYAHSGIDRRGVATQGKDAAAVLRKRFGGHEPGTAERMAFYESAACDLAGRACERAIRDAKVSAADVTHLITVTCTGFQAPGVDRALVDALGLDPTIARTSVGFMGCHGVLNALRVADSIVRADPDAIVLLCSVEVCSAHFQRSGGLDQQIANALFADGAAAAILTAQRSEDRGPVRLDAFRSSVVPDTDDHMRWSIGDHGFEMTLSPRVPPVIEQELPAFIEALAPVRTHEHHNMQWVVHPGGPRVLDAVQSALHLTGEHLAASRGILARHGNMSSATILFILKETLTRKRSGLCIALAFGPGLTMEGALLHLAPTRKAQASGAAAHIVTVGGANHASRCR